MIHIENSYFNINKTLLLSIGLWPYQQSKLMRLRFIFLCSILTSAIFFQFTIFLTSKCTLDLVIKVFSITLLYVVFVLTYVSFGANIEVIKDIMAQLQYIYNELKDENEYAIIEKYGYNAKYLTIILLSMGICGFISFVVSQFWSTFLDVILPMNKSRPHNIQFITEYFVDQEKYVFLILLHMNVALGVGAMGMISTGTMLTTYFQYTCGMFKIASYRLERTIKINSLKRKNVIYNDIICAVDIHRQALKFETMMLCLTGGLVLLLSLNLFRISQIMLSKHDIMEFLLPFLSVTASISYMFVAHNIAQTVTDHNNHVFITAYNVEWYTTPLCIQKMILFLLQKGAKDFTLIVGGIFVASLECFATLVKASISYFAVMHSMR